MVGYLKRRPSATHKRYCKVLKIKDDKELINAYREAHAPGKVWPEITAGMKEVGILDMELYLFDDIVFMIMDTVPGFDHDRAMKLLGSLPRQSEWETEMSKYQVAEGAEDKPEKWKIIERIFELE